MKLQNRVRELRAKHRLSQGDLGKAIGSSRQTISLIERGLCTIYRIVVKNRTNFQCTGGGNIYVSRGEEDDEE